MARNALHSFPLLSKSLLICILGTFQTNSPEMYKHRLQSSCPQRCSLMLCLSKKIQRPLGIQGKERLPLHIFPFLVSLEIGRDPHLSFIILM